MFSDWILVVLRLSLLATPIVSSLTTLASNQLAVGCVLTAWTGPMSHALVGPDNDSIDLMGEYWMLAGLLAMTMRVVDTFGSNTQSDLIWLLPTLSLVLCLGLCEKESDRLKSSDRFTIAGKISLLAVIVSIAIGLVVLGESLGWVVFIAVVQIGWVWYTGTDMLWSMCWMQLCFVPLSPDVNVMAVRLVGVVMLGVVGTLSPTSGGWQLVAIECKNWIEIPIRLIVKIISSILIWQLLFLLGLGLVVTSTANGAWYTAHVDFPDSVANLGKVAMTLVDIIQGFYEFTSDPDFQETLLMAIPEIGAVRGAIYRALSFGYVPFLMAKNGVTLEVAPTDSILGIIGVILMCLAGVCVVLQVFPQSGGVFVENPFFWAIASLSSWFFLAASQLICDVQVVLWHFIMDNTQYTRVFTYAGQYGLIGQCICVASSTAMFVIVMQKDNLDTRLLEKKLGHRSATGGRGLRVVVAVLRPIQALVDYLTTPSMIVLGVTIFYLVTMVPLAGSPFKSIGVEKIKTGNPEWLVATVADKVSGLGLTSLLKMLDPLERLIALGAAMELYAIEKYGCWTCVCLEDFVDALKSVGGFFENVGSKLGGVFHRRRRLLEHTPTQTRYGQRVLQSAAPASCTKPSCSTMRLCVSDIVKDILLELASLVNAGLRFVSTQISNQILNRIPGVSAMNHALSEMEEKLDSFLTFDLFQLPEVNVSFSLAFLGFDLGLVPSFKLPSFNLAASMTTLFVCVFVLFVGCLLAWQIGLLVPMFQSVMLSIELTCITGAIVIASCGFLFGYFVRSEVQTLGYDLKVEWRYPALYLYVLGMAGLLVSMLLKIGETQAQSKMRKLLLQS